MEGFLAGFWDRDRPIPRPGAVGRRGGARWIAGLLTPFCPRDGAGFNHMGRSGGSSQPPRMGLLGQLVGGGGQ
jgi:hypothetical protein